MAEITLDLLNMYVKIQEFISEVCNNILEQGPMFATAIIKKAINIV
ncbi:MAG: hypothetical protein ACRC6X_07820 [Culicoidibacterales bacterium]